LLLASPPSKESGTEQPEAEQRNRGGLGDGVFRSGRLRGIHEEGSPVPIGHCQSDCDPEIAAHELRDNVVERIQRCSLFLLVCKTNRHILIRVVDPIA